MKYFKRIVVFAAVFATSTSQVLAFNFGFVRVPDWMDSYIGWLVVATFAAWIGLFVTKPIGVPFNQLPNVQISPIANFFRFGMLIAVVVLMGMIFLGMGLRRYSEA